MKTPDLNITNLDNYNPDKLIQIVGVSAVAGVLALLVEYFGNGLTLSFMVLALFSSLALTSTFLYREEKASKGIIITIYANVILLSYTAWMGGGLHDFGVTAFTGAMILMALMGNAKHAIVLYIIIICLASFLGITTVNGFNPNPAEEISYAKTMGFVIICSFSSYIAFVFSKGFRGTLKHLSEENIKAHNAQIKLKQLAHYDQLTGLHNRSSILKAYQDQISTLNEQNDCIYLYFIDLDDFKLINDTYNHTIGDELLVEISQRLKTILKHEDSLSRLGGDEFLLALKRSKHFSSSDFADEILHAITQPFSLYDTEIDITSSIGIAVAPQDGTSFDDIRKKADIAMYKAKSLGKNSFCYYNQSLHNEVIRNNEIILGFKKALKDKSLELYFQPKIDIKDGKVNGAEALIRWHKNNPYQSRPDEFIPLIETSDLIIEFSDWVIKQACLACKQWHNQGFDTLSIAVNVSAMQLARSNLKSSIQQALEQANLAPQYLEIELTEHLLLNHSQHVLTQLSEIKKLGVSIAIDDFGTGYSNLSYLTQFKVDTLKLDKSFILKLDQVPENLAMVKAIISMTKIMGLQVVAEGVETQKVWQILQGLGCDYGQGYLWGKPEPNKVFMQKTLKPV